MAIIQTRSKRKVTGGLNRSALTKRLHALARLPTNTKVAERRVIKLKERGGNLKHALLSTDVINVYDPKEKKYKKLKIKTVVDSPANRNFVKRNIITKGSVVETDSGKVRVTSRPGQEATISGILIE